MSRCSRWVLWLMHMQVYEANCGLFCLLVGYGAYLEYWVGNSQFFQSYWAVGSLTPSKLWWYCSVERLSSSNHAALILMRSVSSSDEKWHLCLRLTGKTKVKVTVEIVERKRFLYLTSHRSCCPLKLSSYIQCHCFEIVFFFLFFLMAAIYFSLYCFTHIHYHSKILNEYFLYIL